MIDAAILKFSLSASATLASAWGVRLASISNLPNKELLEGGAWTAFVCFLLYSVKTLWQSNKQLHSKIEEAQRQQTEVLETSLDKNNRTIQDLVAVLSNLKQDDNK